MILVWLILIPLLGGLLAWAAGDRRPAQARWIAMAALAADSVLAASLWLRRGATAMTGGGAWIEQVRADWIPAWGIRFHLGVDGLSLLLVLLTLFIGFLSVACSWREITRRVGFFHFNLLWSLAGILGVFLALDLFLFYFLWELMLIPMYFLIGIWGHENRVYASIKFFLFTQAGGLLMLLSILGLAIAQHANSGVWTFDYPELMGTPLAPGIARWLMLGFFVAFAVKLPAVPLHTWLPDAHTQAPTAGSVILAGLLLKTGGYGLIRFAVPLFPEASAWLAPYAMWLGAAGVIYGAVLAFAQTDLKRLVAYTSVSHLGFVLLGVYAGNQLALQGTVMQMICHGLSTGGLFILVGMLYERTHTRDLDRLGGLWVTAPRMGAAGMVLAMASLGLPGLGNFVAEFLVLVGSFLADRAVTVVAAGGLVLATVYSLYLAQRTFHGPNAAGWKLPDLTPREVAIFGAMVVTLVWLGMYPRPVIDAARPALHAVQQAALMGGEQP
jgi:NADH-quinone oxidoreductase subunit M